MHNNCPFCKDTDVYVYKNDQVTRGGEFRSIYKCRRCLALYPYPKMDKTESSEYLSRFSTNQNEYVFTDPTGPVSDRDPIVRVLKKYTKQKGNALDIGTFEGRFCYILNSLGFKACGIEPQKNAVDFARKHALEVHLGSFPDAIPHELRQKKYDLISVMESIYYFDDIGNALRTMNSMLNDDGRLLIKSHQGYSRYYDNNSYFSRYGDNVQCIPTIGSLRYYLRLAGFDIVKILGEIPAELLPLGMGSIKSIFLRKAVTKMYNIAMLERTSIDVERADRIMVVAKKI